MQCIHYNHCYKSDNHFTFIKSDQLLSLKLELGKFPASRMPLHQLQYFYLSCIVAAVAFSAQYVLADDGSGGSSLVDPEVLNRSLAIGLQITKTYAFTVSSCTYLSSY